MNKKQFISLIGVMVLAIFVSVSMTSTKKAFGDFINPFFGQGTNTGVLCNKNTPTLVLATSTNNQYRRIGNYPTGSVTGMFIYLGYPVSTTTGIFLDASTSIDLSINSTQTYTGAVYCATDANNATATVATLP